MNNFQIEDNNDCFVRRQKDISMNLLNEVSFVGERNPGIVNSFCKTSSKNNITCLHCDFCILCFKEHCCSGLSYFDLILFHKVMFSIQDSRWEDRFLKLTHPNWVPLLHAHTPCFLSNPSFLTSVHVWLEPQPTGMVGRMDSFIWVPMPASFANHQLLFWRLQFHPDFLSSSSFFLSYTKP